MPTEGVNRDVAKGLNDINTDKVCYGQRYHIVNWLNPKLTTLKTFISIYTLNDLKKASNEKYSHVYLIKNEAY